MYIYLSCSSERVFLSHQIDNSKGNFRIALREIRFKVDWFNISEKAKNNWITISDNDSGHEGRITIPDGYYDFCSLKEALDKFGILLTINKANLRITIRFPLIEERREYTFPKSLARILGFHGDGNDYVFSTWGNGREFRGNKPSDFRVNPMLYVHLQQLHPVASWDDVWSSTLLRALPPTKAGFRDYQIHRFGGDSHFRELSRGRINSLDIKITNQDGEPVLFSDLLMVLEIEEHVRKVAGAPRPLED